MTSQQVQAKSPVVKQRKRPHPRLSPCTLWAALPVPSVGSGSVSLSLLLCSTGNRITSRGFARGLSTSFG